MNPIIIARRAPRPRSPPLIYQTNFQENAPCNFLRFLLLFPVTKPPFPASLESTRTSGSADSSASIPSGIPRMRVNFRAELHLSCGCANFTGGSLIANGGNTMRQPNGTVANLQVAFIFYYKSVSKMSRAKWRRRRGEKVSGAVDKRHWTISPNKVSGL